MKKALIIINVFIILFIGILGVFNQTTYAAEAIDSETESNLIKIKEEQLKTVEQYVEKYGSEAYGWTAYILHGIQVYSIPLCFLAIAISAIYRFVIGARHMGNAEKGLGLMVTFVTLTIICQVLPLIFAIVVKFGKE